MEDDESKTNEEQVKDNGENKRFPINSVILSGIIIGAVVVVFLLIATGSNQSIPDQSGVTGRATAEPQASASVEEKHCYEIQVPYTDYETNYVREPYTDQECDYKDLSYKIDKIECNQKTLFSPAFVKYRLYNLDTGESGVWKIWVGFSVDGQPLGFEQNYFAYPQDSIDMQYQFEGKMDYCNYNVLTVAKKQVCRDVIKYRDVPTTKTVTKYRTETKCD